MKINKHIKRISKLIIKWSIILFAVLFVLCSLFVAGRNFVNEGRYFGQYPTCIDTVEIQTDYDNVYWNFAVIKFNNNTDSRYYIERGINCEDFNRLENSKKLSEVYGLSGFKLGVVQAMLGIGTVIGFLCIVCIAAFIVVGILIWPIDTIEKKITRWIEAGGHSKRYRDLYGE